jgi:hypothetical protein
MAHKLKEKEEKEEFFLDVVGLIQKKRGIFPFIYKSTTHPLSFCYFCQILNYRQFMKVFSFLSFSCIGIW